MNLISDQNKGLVGVEGGGEQLIMRDVTQPGTDLEVTLCACAQSVPLEMKQYRNMIGLGGLGSYLLSLDS